MPQRPHLRSQEAGRLRTYLARGQRRKPGLRGLLSPPLYHEIVRAAQQDGIHTAIVRRTHVGYRGQDIDVRDRCELSTMHAPVEVELIAPRKILKLFCYKHAELLRDAVLFFETLEKWELNTLDIANLNSAETAA